MKTGSGAGGASWIAAESEGSGEEASGNGATGCKSIKDGNETGSASRAGSTDSARGGTGRSTLKELEMSLERVGGSSGCEGSSEKRTAAGPGRSDSLIASVSTIESLSSLNIEGRADGNGSESLNEKGGSGVDVMNGAESAGSGDDSG